MNVRCVFPGQVREEAEQARHCASTRRRVISWQDRAAAAARMRRQKLFEDYHFICKCRLCAAEDTAAGAGAGAATATATATATDPGAGTTTTTTTGSGTGTGTGTGTCREKTYRGDDHQEQDALTPIVALLYQQAAQPQRETETEAETRTAAERERDTGRHRDRERAGSRWREYLLEVASRIQELRRIHPPNGTVPSCLPPSLPLSLSLSLPPSRHSPTHSVTHSPTQSLSHSLLSFFLCKLISRSMCTVLQRRQLLSTL